ncbi:MAG: hypothetical protein JWN50_279 [Parcubacteria group bacterium]|nr:hypothetical protein [Parcubacteria group bacterium]
MRYLSLLLMLALPMSNAVSQKPSLKGSAQKLRHDNAVADSEHLSKIKDDKEVERFKSAGLLVPIPDRRYGLIVDPRLPEDRRLCRPQTIRFLKALGKKIYKKFHRYLQVNSCTRDVETQEELRERNRNAAPVSGPTASLHLRGNTVDIRRMGLPDDVQNFVRAELRSLKAACKIDPIEETRQAVWHVAVYKVYDKQGSACAKKQIARSK